MLQKQKCVAQTTCRASPPDGRVRRITLGRFGELTAEKARRHARITLGKISFGQDPRTEKRPAQPKELALAEVYRDYLRARKPHLKPAPSTTTTC